MIIAPPGEVKRKVGTSAEVIVLSFLRASFRPIIAARSMFELQELRRIR